MADQIVRAADEPGEKGGIVTTVKAETTSDLDVRRILREQNGGDGKAAEGDEPEEVKPTAPAEEKFDYNKLTKAQKVEFDAQAAERRRLKQELDRVKTEKPANNGSKPAPAVASETPLLRPTKPDPLKFKTQAEYDAAEAKYEDELFDFKTETKRRQEAVERQQAADRALLDSFQESKEKFIEATTASDEELKHISGLEEPPSFEDATDTDQPMSDVMFGACIEEGPALLYYFATHKQEAAKIYKMGQREQVKAIMRIVVKKLEKDEEPEARPAARTPAQPSRLPRPVEPVGGRGGTPTPAAKKPMTFKEKEQAAAKAGKLNYVP